MTTSRNRHTFVAALFTAWLSACGGGAGDDAASATGTSAGTAESASANGMVVADESVRAQSAVLSTARAVIAIGSAHQTVSCAGGGTALFSATAGTSGSLTNGVLDTGEVYAMQFFACRSTSGSATVTGTMTLSVNSASGENLSVGTQSDVWVTLPERTLRFNGNSTLSHSVQVNGNTRVTTDRWVSPRINTTSVRHNRSTSLSLSNVDLTQTVTTVDGAVTGSTNEGTLTMTYSGWLGTWSATIATQGLVSFSANGVPLGGRWLITLPHDLLLLQVASGVATATLDFGHNGSIDRLFTWPVLVLTGEAD